MAYPLTPYDISWKIFAVNRGIHCLESVLFAFVHPLLESGRGPRCLRKRMQTGMRPPLYLAPLPPIPPLPPPLPLVGGGRVGSAERRSLFFEFGYLPRLFLLKGASPPRRRTNRRTIEKRKTLAGGAPVCGLLPAAAAKGLI